MLKAATLEGRLEALDLVPQATYKILAAATILELSDGWVRRSIKTGLQPGALVDNVWRVSHETLKKWYADTYAKQVRISDRYLNPEALAAEYRPSHVAVKMILSKVQADPELTDEQRGIFTAALYRYRDAWDTAYEARRND